jgi:ABC-type nitrate/sulfonate/bicarbonate transport system substrate-binding protein
MIKPLLGLTATLALCAVTATAQAADKVAIGMSGGINMVPSLVAQAKGYFKEEGLDVTLKPLARGSVAIEGVAGGSLQFSESAHAPFMAAVSRGVPLVAVGIAARGFYGKLVAVPKHANLKTLADFKGMKIGTQVGTGMYTVVQMIMQAQGLKPSDFKISNLRVVDMPAAMAAPSNDFDAVIGWEPGMHAIVQSGHGKIIIEAKQFEDMAHITYPFLLSTTEQYRKQHADIVQKVVNAYAKADKYIRGHHDDAVKVYTAEVHRRGGKLTEDTVRVMLFDTDRFGGAAFTDGDMKDLPQTRDFLMKIGKLKSLPPLDKILDQSFGKKAEAMLTN